MKIADIVEYKPHLVDLRDRGLAIVIGFDEEYDPILYFILTGNRYSEYKYYLRVYDKNAEPCEKPLPNPYPMVCSKLLF